MKNIEVVISETIIHVVRIQVDNDFVEENDDFQDDYILKTAELPVVDFDGASILRVVTWKEI